MYTFLKHSYTKNYTRNTVTWYYHQVYLRLNYFLNLLRRLPLN